MQHVPTFRTVFFFFLFALVSPIVAQKEYKALWDKAYNEWQKQDLPQSAIQTAQEIFRMAESRQDTVQMLRASLFCMYHRNQLSPDSFFVDLPKLEAWASQPNLSPADAAVVHSVLGGIYHRAAQRGYMQQAAEPIRPEVVNEWGNGMYYERAFEHYLTSTQHLETLQDYDLEKTCDIAYNGWWSKLFFKNSLMHLIGRRAIFGIKELSPLLLSFHKQSTWDYPLDYETFMNETPDTLSAFDAPPHTMEIFRRMLKVLDKPAHRDAWLLTEINRLAIITKDAEKNAEYLQILNKYKQTYAQSDVVYTIYHEIAKLLNQERRYAEQLKVVEEALALQKEATIERKKKGQRRPITGDIFLLKNMKQKLLNPELDISCTERLCYPEDTVAITVTHKNLNQFTIKMFRIEAPLDSISKYKNNSEWLRAHSKPAMKQLFRLQPDPSLQLRDTTLYLRLPAIGHYLIEARSGKAVSKRTPFFTLSTLRLECKPLNHDEWEYIVMDNQSGLPVEGAFIQFANQEYGNGHSNPKAIFKTDRQGRVVVKNNQRKEYLRAFTNKEDIMLYKKTPLPISLHNIKGHLENEVELLLMGDRHLYRPGQTLWLKVITFKEGENYSTEVRRDKNIRLKLYDAHGKSISEQHLTTNQYGSHSTRIQLPKTLNGYCHIVAHDLESGKNQFLYFQVEEYKIPTFQALFHNIETAYKAGDTLRLTGEAKTFTAVSVAHATVKYYINRWHQGYFKYPGDYPGHGRHHTITGETTTDENGNFTLEIPLAATHTDKKLGYWRNDYNIQATITSSAGETHEAHTSFTLSSTPLQIRADMPHYWEKGADNQSLKFNVTNLSNQPYAATVFYQIEREGVIVASGNAPSNQAVTLKVLEELPNAQYKLRYAVAEEHSTDSIKDDFTFTLYAREMTKIPAGEENWFKLLDPTFEADKRPALLQIGTNHKELHVRMEVYTEEKAIENRAFTLSDTLQTFAFDYKPEYQKGLWIRIRYVKEGIAYEENCSITLPKPDKKLKLKWKTFRDKLTPGAKEEWTLHVQHPDSTAADAELLACMYDAALNTLTPHRRGWESWNYTFRTFIPAAWVWNNIYTNRSFYYLSVPFDYQKEKVPPLWRYANFASIFTDFRAPRTWVAGTRMNNTMLMKSAATESRADAATEVVFEEEITDAATYAEERDRGDVTPSAPTDKSNTSQLALRKNLTETAFFYPHLQTDKRGEVKIAFTLPENLTTWQFRAFAHSKQMDYNSLTQNIVAQKEFMLTPNLPRFVRMGDKTVISATLTNLTDEIIKGKARIELLHPTTEELLAHDETDFQAAADATSTLSFQLTLSDADVSVAICRIVAEGGDYSDGEQHYLPLLGAGSWITESIPITLTQKGKSEHALNHLFNNHSRTASEQILTIEFTTNPAWIAVQAIPTLADNIQETAYNQAAAWYALSLAEHLLQSQPRIQTVFESWKANGLQPQTLWSELQKDEELKTLLLEETPWIAEAENEAERRQRIALLFNLNNLTAKKEEYMEKLLKLQTPQGGWSWCQGMNENRFITTQIAEMMARIAHLTPNGLSARDQQTLKKAYRYLEKECLNEYQRREKGEKEKGDSLLQPSNLLLQYLYIGAIHPTIGHPDTLLQTIVHQLPALIGKLDIYGKARAAIILNKQGRKEEAEAMLRSVMEYTVCQAALGRYFDTPKATVGWRNKQLTNQVAVIEALSTIRPYDPLPAEEMKQWLLMQKQVQDWGTSMNTADAIYALLIQNPDLMKEKELVSLKLDKRKVSPASPQDVTQGLGYFKRTYTKAELKRLPRKLIIDKPEEGISWGAVYAQYLEKTAHVNNSTRLSTSPETFYQRPLSIERQWLVEVRAGELITWKPVTADTPLKRGDKVTSRLIIRADRDMDFIQIKEERAACTEPTNTLSAYHYNGIGYYQVTKDAATHYYIDHLPKGTFTLESTYYIDRPGTYQTGIATIQCAYAPEYNANSAGSTLEVQP